jgi:hypothetical protein
MILGFFLACLKIRQFRNKPKTEIINSLFDFVFFFPSGFLYPLILIFLGGAWLLYLTDKSNSGSTILTASGLLLDIVGVAMLFKYGPLQPSPHTRPGIALEDNTLCDDGRTVKEHEIENEELLKKYDSRSKIALSTIIIGFLFQFVAVWFK